MRLMPKGRAQNQQVRPILILVTCNGSDKSYKASFQYNKKSHVIGPLQLSSRKIIKFKDTRKQIQKLIE